jgi:hypothetical protein
MVYQGKMNFSFNHFILFSAYLGYIDDVRNTDNAWVEAEIWNFHYGVTMSSPELRTDVCSVFFLKNLHIYMFFLGYGIMERCDI